MIESLQTFHAYFLHHPRNAVGKGSSKLHVQFAREKPPVKLRLLPLTKLVTDLRRASVKAVDETKLALAESKSAESLAEQFKGPDQSDREPFALELPRIEIGRCPEYSRLNAPSLLPPTCPI